MPRRNFRKMTDRFCKGFRNLLFLCALACGALASGAQACGDLAAALGPLACFYLTAVIGAHKTDRITNESKTG